MFVPKNSNFKKPQANDYFRSELRIPTKYYYLDKRTGAKEALSDQDQITMINKYLSPYPDDDGNTSMGNVAPIENSAAY